MTGGLLALGLSSTLSPTATYLLLVGLVAAESAGLPLPGETALITAAILASHGHVKLPLVIVLAIAASVTGDNVGYLVGRHFGRGLLESPRWPFARHRAAVLRHGDEFFARHGGKAVALGRFVTGVRVVVAFLAGVNHLPWPVFALWNVVGAALWATAVGVSAYYVGRAIEHDLLLGGLVAVGIAALLVAHAVVRHARRRT